MAWLGQPVRIEELLFEAQHGIVDQSLHARMGAEPTNGDGFGLGWYDGRAAPAVYRGIAPAWGDANLRALGLEHDPIGALKSAVGHVEAAARRRGVADAVQATFGVANGECLWAVRYASGGRARSLFASADVEAIRRLHPANPRFQRLSAGDRLVVSEPFSDLPGVWREVPEATAVTVRADGGIEERPFRPHS